MPGSLSISQAGGAGVFDAAVRLECEAGFSGAGSILSADGDNDDATVFCLSCDANDLVCDSIIPN